jgi:hypothetical protein
MEHAAVRPSIAPRMNAVKPAPAIKLRVCATMRTSLTARPATTEWTRAKRVRAPQDPAALVARVEWRALVALVALVEVQAWAAQAALQAWAEPAAWPHRAVRAAGQLVRAAKQALVAKLAQEAVRQSSPKAAAIARFQATMLRRAIWPVDC